MTSERDNDTETASGAASDGALPQDPEQLKALLERERERAETSYRNWQRSAADFQNFKRRVEDERSETARMANAALIINMLPIIDDLDRALRNVDSHLAGLTWVDGIRLIYRKFQALLDMAGCEEIAADGETFNPAWHESIGQAPGEEDKVVSVVQKGYKLGDRVVRPAMVIVGAGNAAASGETSAGK